MIRDSRRGFEFSRLISSLSRAFSRQNKKIKTIGIINASVTFKWYERYGNTLNTDCVFFVVLVLSLMFTIEPNNLEKSYSGISEKHDQAPFISLCVILYKLIFELCYVWWNQIVLCLY